MRGLSTRQCALPAFQLPVNRLLVCGLSTAAETTTGTEAAAKKLRYLRKKESIPKPPRRAYTAWQVFLDDAHAKTKGTPGAPDMIQIARQQSALWRSLSDSEKKVYQDRAIVLREQKIKEYNRWLESLSPGDFALLAREHRLKQRLRGTKRRSIIDPNKPKLPLSGYVRFSNEERSKLDSSLPAKEVTRELAQRWNKLSKEQKDVYVEAYKAEMVKYNEDIAVYRAELPKPLNLASALKPAKKVVKKPAKKVAKKPAKKATKKPAKKPAKKATKKPAKKATKKPAAKKPATKKRVSSA
ncbi:hypothetical protein THASP1DRAFT_25746 [Thamnocephalis sphaerospora]|uniref:HMG box domain-containing protein n=1 Tax=Thamnocephalis sphaerospora TaxID=78915 RepID=A0A4P9XJC2_9FUNG|nr:hypothetical protein THASP1DRAFT_25746 [Thamnocephalis sphaerospora]|eukprot:RKP05826.1 hypothetical protein THASP1DRAFT_25746 [Thamnocephalis sphaerospora]